MTHAYKRIVWLLFLIVASTPTPGYAGTETPSGAVADPANLVRLPANFIERMNVDAGRYEGLVTALAGVRKAAILESTRGAVESAVYQKAAPKVALIIAGPAVGSGALVSRDGRVITSAHVVGSMKEVLVVLRPASGAPKPIAAYRARVLRSDSVRDLALLRIEAAPSTLLYFELGSAKDLEVGEDVHAIGYPRGQEWTYTKGVISQIRDDYEWKDESASHRASVIQTQTPLNPGNSGGPLIDDAGRLIGINSFITAETEGLNYAVSVSEVRAFLAATAPTKPVEAATYDNLECPQKYQASIRHTAVIGACYLRKHLPPPDIWMVITNKAGTVGYFAVAAGDSPKRSAKSINTVIVISGKRSPLKHYIDYDCNGTIDLVGMDPLHQGAIVEYELAPRGLTIAGVAPELSDAAKAHLVPDEQLHLCGS